MYKSMFQCKECEELSNSNRNPCCEDAGFSEIVLPSPLVEFDQVDYVISHLPHGSDNPVTEKKSMKLARIPKGIIKLLDVEPIISRKLDIDCVPVKAFLIRAYGQGLPKGYTPQGYILSFESELDMSSSYWFDSPEKAIELLTAYPEHR